ncbi:glycoside hydrolase superfamily [Clohesyomyces aquaticus]|uniref:glucan endo-1,3-beta-D-glucosidase n=1 Tax=Clohesyomyces aquaticus TaxID=1231657 RepID=A0A1Y1ZJV4_9PLEO|nr:glycoside hydrolase superfamily [Clohesyomyces aquaticus]
MLSSRILCITPYLLALVAAKVHTGFNYGAFWSQDKPKYKADFIRGFQLAKSLPNAPVPFDSARLFTNIQWHTENEPIEAFEAAIETNTTLLLGIWASAIDKEFVALDKAFDKYGQKLADLVIGLSVGNEDIFRGSKECVGGHCADGASAEEIMSKVDKVRAHFDQAPWAKLFKDKEKTQIGHVDVAAHANDPMAKTDWVGMTAYPYWAKANIEHANESFFGSLKDVQDKAKDKEVWIAETGWPFTGPRLGDADASAENMQKYWTDVGCSLFGKYNTFWFELIRDADDPGSQDWGLVDVQTLQPRIKDLSCPGLESPQPQPTYGGGNSSLASKTPAPSTPPVVSIPPSTIVTIANPTIPSNHPMSSMPAYNSTSARAGNHTITVTAHDCLTVVDMDHSIFVTVATGSMGPNGTCIPPLGYSNATSTLDAVGSSLSPAGPTPAPLSASLSCVASTPIPTPPSSIISSFVISSVNPSAVLSSGLSAESQFLSTDISSLPIRDIPPSTPPLLHLLQCQDSIYRL